MLRILEIAWLCIGTTLLAIACWLFITEGFTSSSVVILFGVGIAAAKYFVRRKQRIRFDRERQQNTSND